MKPIIGITCDFEYASIGSNVSVFNTDGRAGLFEGYYKGVEMAGGIPVIIPIIDESNVDDLLSRVDGIIATGGRDVDPLLYGEDPIRELANMSPERDIIELAIVKKALENNIPLFGICRGVQIMNVATGGTLYQDIYVQNKNKGIINHGQSSPGWHGTHKASIDKNSRLKDILGVEEIFINSFHHQAVKDLGKGYVISALAPDGIIEGIEYKDHRFAIGVQWHPERMWRKNELFLKLFKGLVEEAGKSVLK